MVPTFHVFAKRLEARGCAAPLPSMAAQMALRADIHLVAWNELEQSHCVATPPGSICIGTGLSAVRHDIGLETFET